MRQGVQQRLIALDDRERWTLTTVGVGIDNRCKQRDPDHPVRELRVNVPSQESAQRAGQQGKRPPADEVRYLLEEPGRELG